MISFLSTCPALSGGCHRHVSVWYFPCVAKNVGSCCTSSAELPVTMAPLIISVQHYFEMLKWCSCVSQCNTNYASMGAKVHAPSFPNADNFLASMSACCSLRHPGCPVCNKVRLFIPCYCWPNTESLLSCSLWIARLYVVLYVTHSTQCL